MKILKKAYFSTYKFALQLNMHNWRIKKLNERIKCKNITETF